MQINYNEDTMQLTNTFCSSYLVGHGENETEYVGEGSRYTGENDIAK